MPVPEFDECDYPLINPLTGEQLRNFWGYQPIAFFAPKAAYAAEPGPGDAVREFKAMVKAFHEAGIEVILDVVFNHTGEGDERGPTFSFRGLDNRPTTCSTETGKYLNFSGCGNTVNCNHPVVRDLILAACATGWPRCTSTASASTWPRSSAAAATARCCRTRRCSRRSPRTRCWPTPS